MKHLRKINDTFGVILQMMNNMGGEDDLPDLDGADDVSFFSPFCLLSKHFFGLYVILKTDYGVPAY